MKINRLIISFAICSAFLLPMTACQGELDIPAHGVASTMADFYKTDDDAESAIAAVYKQWRSDYSKLMETLNALGDDVMNGGHSSDMRYEFRYMNYRLIDEGNSAVESLYKALYTELYYCNLVLDNVDESSDIKKRCRAEAKFFRAFANFYLGLLWGQDVPLVDHVLLPSEYHIGKCEEGARWALIEKDLSEAAAALPSKNGPNDLTYAYRVTRETALTMLGKAYLWQEKYEDAYNQFKAVITSGKYALYQGNYNDLFHADDTYQTIGERVLCAFIPDDNENGRDNGIFDGTTEFFYGSTSNRAFASCRKRADGKDQYLHNGRCMWAPREGLYNAFVETEGVSGSRLLGSVLTTEQMVSIEGYTLANTGTVYHHDNYWSRKTNPYLSDVMGESPGKMMANNLKIPFSYIRYSEVLLLGAEAALKAGKAEADTWLNEVRSRAGLSNATATMDVIKNEKRLELCQEGTRYLDLLRWGDAMTVLKDQGKDVCTFTIKNGQIKIEHSNPYESINPGLHYEWQLLLPIPTCEINVNGEYNTQNEGYAGYSIAFPAEQSGGPGGGGPGGGGPGGSGPGGDQGGPGGDQGGQGGQGGGPGGA